MGGINTVDSRVYDDNDQSPAFSKCLSGKTKIGQIDLPTLSMEKSLSLQKEKSMSGQLHSL